MGVDISDVERIQGAIERHGEVFLRRVYTTREREYCERFKNKYERYAGRFAAKEAAMKALGTGVAARGEMGGLGSGAGDERAADAGDNRGGGENCATAWGEERGAQHHAYREPSAGAGDF